MSCLPGNEVLHQVYHSGPSGRLAVKKELGRLKMRIVRPTVPSLVQCGWEIRNIPKQCAGVQGFGCQRKESPRNSSSVGCGLPENRRAKVAASPADLAPPQGALSAVMRLKTLFAPGAKGPPGLSSDSHSSLDFIYKLACLEGKISCS